MSRKNVWSCYGLRKSSSLNRKFEAFKLIRSPEYSEHYFRRGLHSTLVMHSFGTSRSRSCRQDVVETEWRSRAAHARRGKRRYRARRLVRPLTETVRQRQFLPSRPEDVRRRSVISRVQHVSASSGPLSSVFTSKIFSPFAGARRGADVRAELCRRMRSSPSSLSLSSFDG